MTTIKLTFGEEIRRVSVADTSLNSLAQLVSTARNLFPALANDVPVVFIWYDDVGDKITVSSELELQEALRFMREQAAADGKSIVRFEVVALDEPMPTSEPTPASVGEAVHVGITCDECGMSPIRGLRFKCTVREDYDLCAACEARREQPYPMVKIAQPGQGPAALFYAFREDGPHCHPPRPHHHPGHHGLHHPHGHGPHGHHPHPHGHGPHGHHPHPHGPRGHPHGPGPHPHGHLHHGVRPFGHHPDGPHPHPEGPRHPRPFGFPFHPRPHGPEGEKHGVPPPPHPPVFPGQAYRLSPPPAFPVAEVEGERVEKTAAAAVPAPAPAVSDPTTPAAASSPAPVQPLQLLWRRELSMLADMGFVDAEAALPLLQRHLVTPVSLSGDRTAAPSAVGMQRVVAELLTK